MSHFQQRVPSLRYLLQIENLHISDGCFYLYSTELSHWGYNCEDEGESACGASSLEISTYNKQRKFECEHGSVLDGILDRSQSLQSNREGAPNVDMHESDISAIQPETKHCKHM